MANPYFTDEETLKKWTPLVKANTGDTVSRALKRRPAAYARMIALVGQTLYDEVKALQTAFQANTDNVQGADLIKLEAFEQAEAILTLYYALPYLNLKIQEKGGLVWSVGIPQQGETRLLTRKEVKRYQRSFYADATAPLAPYILDEDGEVLDGETSAFKFELI